MIKSLTAREKVMLYALALFLLAVACVYFVIMPTAAQTADLRAAVEMTRQSDQIVRGAVKDMATAAEQMSQLERQAAELAERQLPLMTNSALDALITGMMLESGLEPQSLALSRPLVDFVPAKGETARPGDDSGAASMTQNTASAVFLGNLTGFARFVEKIESIDAVRITYVSYGAPQRDGIYTFSVGLVVYMDAGRQR